MIQRNDSWHHNDCIVSHLKFQFVWVHNNRAYTRENLSSVFANNKGEDQPAHPHSLISAFDIRLLESKVSELATSEFSIFQLISVAKETGLSLALSESLKPGFATLRPMILTSELFTFLEVTFNIVYFDNIARTFMTPWWLQSRSPLISICLIT